MTRELGSPGVHDLLEEETVRDNPFDIAMGRAATAEQKEKLMNFLLLMQTGKKFAEFRSEIADLLTTEIQLTPLQRENLQDFTDTGQMHLMVTSQNFRIAETDRRISVAYSNIESGTSPYSYYFWISAFDQANSLAGDLVLVVPEMPAIIIPREAIDAYDDRSGEVELPDWNTPAGSSMWRDPYWEVFGVRRLSSDELEQFSGALESASIDWEKLVSSL